MTALEELQKTGMLLDIDYLKESLNKADETYGGLFDASEVLRDIILNNELDYEKIGREFAEALAIEYIADNAKALCEAEKARKNKYSLMA